MIIRHKHKGRFAIVPNGIFHDPRLSLGAKGLLAFLLSLPPGWEIRHDQLQRKLGIGRKLLDKLFKELIAAGYAVRDRVQGRDEHNRFTTLNYVVTDIPTEKISDVPSAVRPEPQRRGSNGNNKEEIKTDSTNPFSKSLPTEQGQTNGARQVIASDSGQRALEAGNNPAFVGSKPYEPWRRFRGGVDTMSGVIDHALTVEQEPQHFRGFFESCQHWRTMSRDKALAAFRFLTATEQMLARAAASLHAAECDKAKRKSLDAHKLIAERFWTKYPHARLPEQQPSPQPMRQIVGNELAGLRVAVRIAEQRELRIDHTIQTRKTQIQSDLEALARWADDSRREGWHVVETGTAQFAAWRERLKFWIGGLEPIAERIWTEHHDPAAHDLPRTHPNFRPRKSVNGFRVPAPWPPGPDGAWATDGREAE
jgi:hypothetical protein